MYKLYVHHYDLLLALQKIEQKGTYIYIKLWQANMPLDSNCKFQPIVAITNLDHYIGGKTLL